MIGAVLFDVDGTLIDSNDLHAAAWQEAFRHFGVDLLFDRIRGQIGKGGDNLIPALLPKPLVEAQQEDIENFRSQLFMRDYLPRAVPFPDVRALFERIVGDGKRVVLASSAKGAEVDFHLNITGAADLVTGVTSADDVDRSKPCPDIFEAALRKVPPLTAEEVVVVGDSPYDASAAKALGMKVIGLRCGGFAEDALRQAGVDQMFDDPSDLLRRYEASLLAG